MNDSKLSPGDVVESGSLATFDYLSGVVVAVVGNEVSVKVDRGGFEIFKADQLRKQDRAKRLAHRYW